MNDPELIDEARRWLRFATEDLKVEENIDDFERPAR